jgi:hypothetical protein
MRIEGLRIAKITAKHSSAVQVILDSHAWVPWMLCGACRSPSFSIKLFGPEENIGLSVCLWKKKLRLEARVHWGGCKPWNADFEAFSDQFCWMRCFGVLRSHKICRILKRAGREEEVRQIGREKAAFLREVHPKNIQHHARYFPPFLFFVRTKAMNAAVKMS